MDCANSILDKIPDGMVLSFAVILLLFRYLERRNKSPDPLE